MPATPIRYQVFISSTFKDLGPERAAVLNMVLSLNHIPAGMELFPAAPQTPWEIIQRVIDLSDYYVLVIAGMYGSTDDSGISYTEKEYEYARDKGKYVIPLIHDSPGDIPSKHVEKDEANRQKLEAFIEKVRLRHTVTTWKTAGDLAGKVAQSLNQAINQSPLVGWVRADGIDNTDLLKKVADLHERIAQLTAENRRLHDVHGGIGQAEIAAMADRLDMMAAAWFLNLTSKRAGFKTKSDLPDEIRDTVHALQKAGFLHIQLHSSLVVPTQMAWQLRDELLRRAVLKRCLNDKDARVTLPNSAGANEQESAKTIDQLVSQNYLSLVGEDGIRLTVEGKMLAERLERMEH